MPRDPPRAQAFFEDFPLVLWVRDPVSRFLSCWDAWLFVDGNATVLERRQARWQAVVSRVTGEHVEAADLNRVLLTLREKKNFSLTRRVLATGVYRHRWRPGDLVLWDNRVLLHAATPFDAEKHTRLIYRAGFPGERVYL